MGTSEQAEDACLLEVLSWLRDVAVAPLLELRIDAEPAPVTRQAFVVGGRAMVVHGKRYKTFLVESVKQLSKQKPAEQLSGDLMAVFEVILPKPKTTKRKRPVGDWDNLLKGPQDAVTQAGIWDDDDSVISAFAVKRWAAQGEQPGVNIWIGRLP